MDGRLTLITSVLNNTLSYLLASCHLPRAIMNHIEKLCRTFLWNGRNHFIRWNEICSPKNIGDLGIVDMVKWQEALMAKPAHRILARDDSLLCNLLIPKYGGRKTPFSLNRGDAWTWKLICKGGNLAAENLLWMVGDGVKINILKNDRISYQPLCKSPSFLGDNLGETETVSALLTSNSEWNIQLLREIFRAPLVDRMTSLPRENLGCPDQLVWLSTEKENCKVSHLYNSTFSMDPVSPDYSWIWKVDLQPRIHTFLWRLARNSIPTRLWEASHNDYILPSCPWGCSEVECLNHIFSSCTYSEKYWTLFSDIYPDFQLTSLDKIMEQLSCHNRTHHITPAARLLYHIWHAHNCHTHAESTQSPSLSVSLAAGSSSYNGNWDQVCPLGTSNPSTSWFPPPHGWIKINFDGALLENSASGIGFICRDHLGEPLSAASLLHISATINMIELRACRFGLECCLELIKNVEGIVVEGDSLAAINMIRTYDTTSQNETSLGIIAAILSTSKKYVLSNVLRSANMAANLIVHKCFSLNFNWSRGIPLPTDVLNIVRQDCDVF